MSNRPEDNLPQDSGRPDPEPWTSEAARLVRLFRVAEESNLSALTRSDLGAELLRMLDEISADQVHLQGGHDPGDVHLLPGVAPPQDQKLSLGRRNDDFFSNDNPPSESAPLPSLSSSALTERPGGFMGATAFEARPILGSTRDPACQVLEMRLRQLAQASAPWARMEPIAFDLFKRVGSPTLAARLLELAFLHGRVENVAELINHFRVMAPGFYPHIHAAIRAHIVVRFFARDLDSAGLSSILFVDREAEYVQPTERLFLLLSMLAGKDQSHGYSFFRRHHRALLDAAASVGGSFGLTPSSLYLKIARVAASLQNLAEAREYLENIPQDAPERDEALVFLLGLDADNAKEGQSQYVLELDAAPGDRTRLDKLASFLAATRGLGGYKDRNRPALNEILRHPLEWFGDLPEIWARLSHVLVGSRDLGALLPNLWDLFKSNALTWHTPSLDAALWQGPLQLESEEPLDRYWHGVAKLHQYVNTQGAEGAALWEARNLIYQARLSMAPKADLYDWTELHRATFAWVAKSHHLLEQDRSRMLRELRLASPDSNASLADVDDYLNLPHLASMPILDRLIRIAQMKKALALEARILISRAFHCHLTNRDLNRLWQIGCERKDHDLAWRVATVLRSRGALVKEIHHPWDISGEKRSHYQSLRPTFKQVILCLDGLSKPEERLAKAILIVGPLLPELFALLDEKSTSSRISSPPADSSEAHADHALAQLDWLPPQRRRYVFSFSQAGSDGDIPAFAQVLPVNLWSVLLSRLSDRLGLTAWHWCLSFLSEQIVDVIPRLATRRDLGRNSNKVGKWLRSLSPDQRAAWQDLSSLSRTMSDAAALHTLSVLVCRTALLIIPNHALALSTLMAMRAPIAVTWDLEQFILSTFYSEYRNGMGLTHKVPIPNSLIRLTNALESANRS